MPEASAAGGGGQPVHPDFSKGFNGGMMPEFWRTVDDGQFACLCLAQFVEKQLEVLILQFALATAHLVDAVRSSCRCCALIS